MSVPAEQIFVSYARADEPVVSEIYKRLREAGYRVWMDRAELTGGADWRAEILRAIRSSDYFLAMLSDNSVDRAGVLRGELREALAIRGERLDRGGFLIPVRLTDCKIPAELSEIHWVDWFAPDGWTQLRRALAPRRSRRRWSTAAAALLVFIAVGAGYLLWQYWPQVNKQADEIAVFKSARPGSNEGPGRAAPPQVGMTLWQIRETGAQSDGPCPGLSMTRIPFSSPLQWNDAVRLGIESSQPGYLYVFGQELEGDSADEAELLYPTLRLAGGDNRIEPGTLVEIPPAERCASFRLERSGPAHTGELLTVVVAPEPLSELRPALDPVRVDARVLRAIESKAAVALRETTSAAGLGSLKTAAEEEAGGRARKLRWNEIAPQAVYTFPESRIVPMLVRVRVQVRSD